MARRHRRVAVLQPPEVLWGSLVRGFRVRLGVPLADCARVAGCTGFRRGSGPPELQYMLDVEDPPEGLNAVDVQAGRWWRDGGIAARRVVAMLWERAERVDREWLRAHARAH